MSIDIDENAESYLLSERELKILLAGTSHSRIFGLFSEKAGRYDEDRADVLNTVANMARFNKIAAEGASFTINETIASIVSFIGSAQHVLSVSLPDSELPLLCYCGEQAVLCKRVVYQPGMLRVKLYAPDELAHELIDISALPDFADAPRELTEFALWNNSGGEIFSAELFYKGKFQLRFSVRDSVTESLKLITEHESGEKTACAYSKEQLFAMLSYYLKLTDGGKTVES